MTLPTAPDRRGGIGSHTRPVEGSTDVWLTPPGIIRALGPFDLDPCAAPDPRPWPTARYHITLPDDGLAAPWRGRVWLNPPYGQRTWDWLARLADHGPGVALVFARTETRGFVRTVWDRAAAVLFLAGRLSFLNRHGHDPGVSNAGGPSCLVAYTPADAARLADAGLDGVYVDGWRRVGPPRLFGDAP